MEKRRSGRLKISLKAERIYGSGSHTVFIENISESGILIEIPHSDETEKYISGADIDLKFRFTSGKTVMLTCKVSWSCSKTPPDGLTDNIGLEIINPPELYRNFVRSLHK